MPKASVSPAYVIRPMVGPKATVQLVYVPCSVKSSVPLGRVMGLEISGRTSSGSAAVPQSSRAIEENRASMCRFIADTNSAQRGRFVTSRQSRDGAHVRADARADGAGETQSATEVGRQWIAGEERGNEAVAGAGGVGHRHRWRRGTNGLAVAPPHRALRAQGHGGQLHAQGIESIESHVRGGHAQAVLQLVLRELDHVA